MEFHITRELSQITREGLDHMKVEGSNFKRILKTPQGSKSIYKHFVHIEHASVPMIHLVWYTARRNFPAKLRTDFKNTSWALYNYKDLVSSGASF